MAWFKKSKPDRRPSEAAVPETVAAVSGATTHLGPGLRIRGNIAGKDPIRIEARLEGDILLESELNVLPEAHLQGKIKAARMSVSGTIEGELEAFSNLQILGSAVISGDVRTPELRIHEGAVINGRITMKT